MRPQEIRDILEMVAEWEMQEADALMGRTALAESHSVCQVIVNNRVKDWKTGDVIALIDAIKRAPVNSLRLDLVEMLEGLIALRAISGTI